MIHSNTRTEKVLKVILPAQQATSQISQTSSIKLFEGLSNVHIQADDGRRGVARGLRRPQQSIIPTRVPLSSSVSRRKISFLAREGTPYTDLLVKNRQIKEIDQASSTNVLTVAQAFTRLTVQTSARLDSKISEESVKVAKSVNSPAEGIRKSTLILKASDISIGEAASIERVPILELLRRRRESDQSSKDGSMQNDICPHGLLTKPLSPNSSNKRSITSVENSSSKSTIRSNSQRMDADVTSMLNYMSTLPASQAHSSGGEEYHKSKFRSPNGVAGAPQLWTLRRSVCPVCSQKWRDRSSINNVKYSGLKRHTASDVMPSIAAPARLRTSVVTDTTDTRETEYCPWSTSQDQCRCTDLPGHF